MTVSVLPFGDRRIPRRLANLPELPLGAVTATLDATRLIVVGADADLGAVLSRLLSSDRLDVEVAYVPRRRSAATRAYGLPAGGSAARAAATGTARDMPLIRDELGNVLVGAALWAGEAGAPLHGEAVVDDAVLFDGEVIGVRIEPTRDMPGLRAAAVRGRMRPTGWIRGRAAQLGTTGAVVERDGERSPRTVRRFAYYRHVRGWRAVG